MSDEDVAVTGPDGLPRCPWGLGSSEYLEYHDAEWGCPVRDDNGLFERLCLEVFQSGLSWLIILRKREAFRAAFDAFDIGSVADFGQAAVTRLLADPGIVRNRAKIEAVIGNARAAARLTGGLGKLMWRYAAEPGQMPPRRLSDVPSRTQGSIALASDLRAAGFRFTGPVTVYAAMQSCGLVDDHLAGCFRAAAPRP
jgi:DNA-3-methyladenine glycosylase I